MAMDIAAGAPSCVEEPSEPPSEQLSGSEPDGREGAPLAPTDSKPGPKIARASINFFGSLSVLMETRLTLARSLRRLADTALVPGERELCQVLLTDMEHGSSFLEAVRRRRESFSDRQLGWLAVADATGDMEKVLPFLFRFEWMNSALRLNMLAACLYLLVLIGLVTLVLGGFLALLLLIALACWVAHRVWKDWDEPKTQLRLARSLMLIPGIGDVVRTWMAAQFSRALAMLLESGVPVAQSIMLGGGVVGTILAEAASEKAQAAFFEERSLSFGLGQAGFFSPGFLSSVQCAEETGSVSQVLEWLADEAEAEVPVVAEGLIRNWRRISLIGMSAVLASLFLVPLSVAHRLVEGRTPAQVRETFRPHPARVILAPSATPLPQPTATAKAKTVIKKGKKG